MVPLIFTGPLKSYRIGPNINCFHNMSAFVIHKHLLYNNNNNNNRLFAQQNQIPITGQKIKRNSYIHICTMYNRGHPKVNDSLRTINFILALQ
jgi:hypothetical protein